MPEAIGHVVESLVANACDAVAERQASGDGAPSDDASPWTPAIHVATRRVGEEVEVVIADNGPGVPASIAERLFEPFVTTKPSGQGLGLSLSVARDVAESHGGGLDAEPTPGGGATFVLRLPLQATPEVAVPVLE